MDKSVYKFKTVPYDHQFIGWDISKRSKYFAYLMDLGTGKTKVTLDCAAYMYDQGWINALMVFGNNGSYTNWVDAIQEHLPDHIKYSLGIWSSKNSAKQKREMEKAIATNQLCLKIFLMNIEALSYPSGVTAAYNFVRANKTLAVVDESTTISNPQSARTKAAFKIRDAAIARRILTGSSVDNRPLDIWAQLQFLANGASGYTSYYAFRSQYAELEERRVQRSGTLQSFKAVTGYKNLDRLKETISKISYIVKKEDCLDLPKKTTMFYNVELTEEQRTIYENLKKRSIAEIENYFDTTNIEFASSIVSVKIALTKMLRLHQIVCGHVKDDEGVLKSIKSNRLKALEEVLEEVSGKAVIWTHFTYDVENIAKFLREKYGPDSVLTYYGDTPSDQREYVKKVFKRGGEVDNIRWLVANDKTGGFGNNWTAVTTSIYYSYDFDNNIHHQTKDRIHRIGQIEPVTYVYLRAKETIDERILSVLTGKQTLADLLTPSNWKDNFK